MPFLFANNAVSTLAAPAQPSDASLTLAAGGGAFFPEPDADLGESFHVTLVDASGASEIVRVAAREDDVLTVERGRDGSSPRAFAAGAAVELRLTAETMRDMVQRGELDAQEPTTLKGVRYAAASPAVADHGDPSARGSLAWVLAQAGSGQAEIELPGPNVYRVGRDLTIPASAVLRVRRGAVLLLDWGVALTVDGELVAGRHAVFDGEGSVAGSFGGGAVLPHWFGAKGDGAADDSAALSRALAFPKVFLPAGTYLVSAPLPLSAAGSLEGEAQGQGYVDWSGDFEKEEPTYSGRASIIQRVQGSHGALLQPADGVSFRNLVFRCGQVRTTADALFSGAASHLRLEDCRVENLETVFADPLGGSSFGGVTALACRFFGCGKVFQGALVDCLVQACLFTTNSRAFELTSGSGLNTIVGNRFEWNDVAVSLYQARSNVISGNVFDASGETAIRIAASAHAQITGNLFWRNGRDGTAPGKRSHIHLKDGAANNNIVGNAFLRGEPDGAPQAVWPRFVLEIESCPSGANVFRDNDTIIGCVDMPVEDPWWTSADALLADDFHVKGLGNPGASNDALVEILKRVAYVCAGPVDVHLYESRKWTAYTEIDPNKVTLVGHGAVTLTNTTGQSHSLRGLRSLTYGQAYSRPPAQSTAAAAPTLGYWPQGSVVWNAAPVAGGVVGWVCVAAGAPGTWKGFGGIGA